MFTKRYLPRKPFLMTTLTPLMFCSPTVIFIRFASDKNQGIGGGLSSESPPISTGKISNIVSQEPIRNLTNWFIQTN